MPEICRADRFRQLDQQRSESDGIQNGYST
jgi:hypothetical protein